MKTTFKQLFLLAAAAILFSACTEDRVINEPGFLVPKTVEKDPTLPAISVNGAMLHSEAFGHPDNAIIVAIHGGPGSDYRYMLNLKEFANHGYRVVFYDQIGSGLSQRFSKNFYKSKGRNAVDIFYDELTGVIARYKTHADQKVFLMGHSWGGILATAYAGKYPNAIQGLVVGEPGGLKWKDIMDYVDESRSFNFWGEALNDVTYLDQFITGNEDDHAILDYKIAMLSSKNDVTGDDETSGSHFWRRGAVINTAMFEIGEDYKPDFSEGIQNFTKPVLFFFSEKNKAYPLSWAQKISSVYNSVDVQKVDGAGHTGIVFDKNVWTKTTFPKALSYFNSLNQ